MSFRTPSRSYLGLKGLGATPSQYFIGDNRLIHAAKYGVMAINGAINMGLFQQWDNGDPIQNDGRPMSQRYAEGLTNLKPSDFWLIPDDQYDYILVNYDPTSLGFAVSDKAAFVDGYLAQKGLKRATQEIIDTSGTTAGASQPYIPPAVITSTATTSQTNPPINPPTPPPAVPPLPQPPPPVDPGYAETQDYVICPDGTKVRSPYICPDGSVADSTPPPPAGQEKEVTFAQATGAPGWLWIAAALAGYYLLWKAGQ
jgi:hypothetical protein